MVSWTPTRNEFYYKIEPWTLLLLYITRGVPAVCAQPQCRHTRAFVWRCFFLSCEKCAFYTAQNSKRQSKRVAFFICVIQDAALLHNLPLLSIRIQEVWVSDVVTTWPWGRGLLLEQTQKILNLFSGLHWYMLPYIFDYAAYRRLGFYFLFESKTNRLSPAVKLNLIVLTQILNWGASRRCNPDLVGCRNNFSPCGYVIIRSIL